MCNMYRDYEWESPIRRLCIANAISMAPNCYSKRIAMIRHCVVRTTELDLQNAMLWIEGIHVPILVDPANWPSSPLCVCCIIPSKQQWGPQESIRAPTHSCVSSSYRRPWCAALQFPPDTANHQCSSTSSSSLCAIQLIRTTSSSPTYALAGTPRAPLGAPVWKPLLNLREMPLRLRMRPVPVVFLRLAFSLQLSTW